MTLDHPTRGSATAPSVETGAGVVRGHQRPDHTFYPDVPYARQPVGDLRFAAPQRPERVVGEAVNARPAGAPPQLPSPFAGFLGDADREQDEACLTLNVWVPPAAETASCPVLVFLHGGSYMIGDARLARYDGAELCAEQNVVVVTVNYRVGLLGFLAADDARSVTPSGSGDDLSFGEDSSPVLDPGLWDMAAALRWVHAEIAAFGGDPRAITVCGQSAGGHALARLLGHPPVRALMRRALFHSPPLGMPSMGRTAAAEQLREVERLLEVSGTAALRRVPTAAILEAQGSLLSAPRGFADAIPPIRHVADDDVDLAPDRALHEGDWTDVDLFLGTNQDECRFWFVWDQGIRDASTEQILGLLRDQVGDRAEECLERYREECGPESVDIVAAARTDHFFHGPLSRAAAAATARGVPTRTFRLDRPLTGEYRDLGCCHCLDLAFLLGGPDSRDAPWLATEDHDDLGAVRGHVRRRWADFLRGRLPAPVAADPAPGPAGTVRIV
jgi:para-nitrobenzyl esterase